MEFDYVFGDLLVQVTFKADNDSPFGTLTDKQTMVLQQVVYMCLKEFMYINAILLAERSTPNELEGQDEGMGRR